MRTSLWPVGCVRTHGAPSLRHVIVLRPFIVVSVYLVVNTGILILKL